MVGFDRQPFNLLFFNQVFVFLLLFVIASVICIIAWLELQCPPHLGATTKLFVGLVNLTGQSSFDLTSCVKSQQCLPTFVK